MNQSIGPTQVNEGAKITYACYFTFADFPLVDFGQQALFLLVAPILKRRPLGKYYSIAISVYLDNFESWTCPHSLGEPTFYLLLAI